MFRSVSTATKQFLWLSAGSPSNLKKQTLTHTFRPIKRKIKSRVLLDLINVTAEQRRKLKKIIKRNNFVSMYRNVNF
jgi:hypothetical protein